MLSITSVMILPPYLACTLFLWKSCCKKGFPATASVGAAFATLCGVAGSLYALWMIYAAGLKYLAMAFIFLLIGIPIFIWARHNRQQDAQTSEPYFTTPEYIGAAVIIIVAVVSAIAAITGKIQL